MASKNLDEIEKYIDQDNPHTAVETVPNVINFVKQLSKHPAIGRTGRIEDTRALIIPDTPFIAPYKVKNKTIEVLCVFHHSRKWPNRMNVVPIQSLLHAGVELEYG